MTLHSTMPVCHGEREQLLLQENGGLQERVASLEQALLAVVTMYCLDTLTVEQAKKFLSIHGLDKP